MARQVWGPESLPRALRAHRSGRQTCSQAQGPRRCLYAGLGKETRRPAGSRGPRGQAWGGGGRLTPLLLLHPMQRRSTPPPPPQPHTHNSSRPLTVHLLTYGHTSVFIFKHVQENFFPLERKQRGSDVAVQQRSQRGTSAPLCKVAPSQSRLPPTRRAPLWQSSRARGRTL